jgi:hypothetical protein
VPFIVQLRRIDPRVQTIQIARQQVITKDNLPVGIEAVPFFKARCAASISDGCNSAKSSRAGPNAIQDGGP